MTAFSMSDVLAQNLRREMERQELSMAALSRLAGTNDTQVYDILNARTRSPRLDTVEKLATALHLSVLDLLTSGQRERAEQELLEVFRMLRSDDQQRLLEVALAWNHAKDRTSPQS
jgi:transcriptional regulator with XRE-family HTH domain